MTDSLCSCHTPLRLFLSKRPVVLAMEFVAAALIASAGGWVANRFSRKENRQAQALERIAGAVETFAAPPKNYEAMPEPPKRRKLTAREDKFITAHQECWSDAYIGYDNELHPDYCRP